MFVLIFFPGEESRIDTDEPSTDWGRWKGFEPCLPALPASSAGVDMPLSVDVSGWSPLQPPKYKLSLCMLQWKAVCAWILSIWLEIGWASAEGGAARSGMSLRSDQGRRLQRASLPAPAPRIRALPFQKGEFGMEFVKSWGFFLLFFSPDDSRASQQSHVNTCPPKEHCHSAIWESHAS